ncbi:hypothetical protein EDC01DRAFT_728534 [Geopyxis carbonaria]|nr:hypothetical protein EDC01DRAFT_728534 [Geopyxis carbonaria]
MDPNATFTAAQLEPPFTGRDSNTVFIFCLVLTTVTTIVVGVRFYARIAVAGGGLGLDDWFMVPAILLTIAHGVTACVADLRGGIGRPLWEVQGHEWTIWFQTIMASSFIYPAMTGCIRISILLFYRRLLDRSTTFERHFITTLLVSVIPYVIIYEFLTGFMCRPIASAWDPYVRNRDCGDVFYYNMTVSQYSVSLVFDTVILVLPLRPIWNLEISVKQRIAVLAMLMMGASACAAVATKLGLFITEQYRYLDIDPRWAANPLSRFIPGQFDRYGYTYWFPAQIEPCIAIIGSSLPAMKVLITATIEKSRMGVSKFSAGSNGTSKSSSSRGGPGWPLASAHKKQMSDSNEALAHAAANGYHMATIKTGGEKRGSGGSEGDEDPYAIRHTRSVDVSSARRQF